MSPGDRTTEPLGLNLSAVITTISGIHALQQQMKSAVHKAQPHTLKALTSRWQEAKRILATRLPTLTDAERDQVVQRYPDVVS